MSCAKAAGTAQLAPSPRQVKRDATETTRRDLESEHHSHWCLCSAPPAAPHTVCSEHRSTQPSRSSAQRLSEGGRKSYSCWTQGLLNSTWGAAAAPAAGTGHTRTDKVSQSRNTCISAAERLLQRQWREHRAASLTELGHLLQRNIRSGTVVQTSLRTVRIRGYRDHKKAVLTQDKVYPQHWEERQEHGWALEKLQLCCGGTLEQDRQERGWGKQELESRCREESAGEVSRIHKNWRCKHEPGRFWISDSCHLPLLNTQPAARRMRCEQVEIFKGGGNTSECSSALWRPHEETNVLRVHSLPPAMLLFYKVKLPQSTLYLFLIWYILVLAFSESEWLDNTP